MKGNMVNLTFSLSYLSLNYPFSLKWIILNISSLDGVKLSMVLLTLNYTGYYSVIYEC